MELTFLGRGSAFNNKEINNSCFFIEDDELFLIDCGFSVFNSLKEMFNNEKFDNIKKINILVTHTHPDHIGSLGNLIFFAYHMLKIECNIIVPSIAQKTENISLNELSNSDKKIDIITSINAILRLSGCDESHYNLIYDKDLDNKYKLFNKIEYKHTSHSEELDCYGIAFETDNGIVYYSGDTNEINEYLSSIIANNEKIDKLYIETTLSNYEGNVHLNINILDSIIPNYLKSKIYLMHFDNQECINEALKRGYNIANTINIEDYSIDLEQQKKL